MWISKKIKFKINKILNYNNKIMSKNIKNNKNNTK